MAKPPKNENSTRLSARLKAIADRDPLDAGSYRSASTTNQRPVRAPAYKPAVLVVGDSEKVPVVIKNLSKTGAKVAFFQNRELSGRVQLIEQSINLNVAADVVWQRDGMLGLIFVQS